ncbi:YgfZ/GcvT domain-containing protein [Marinicella litoralis]|uniref:Aminomethyltransferase folate-binding domain-containing protein n=1 Tax=Marinicella litoralis TaxID=644220 RepID=A0A4R6Y0N2_9GAMM|nr:hypothetical protein [Marinicella litoralis]TDR22478.1 hypothetical protein C8D91_0969 [Marinicella litoralis]
MSNEPVFNNLSVFEVNGADTEVFLKNQLISEFNQNSKVSYSAICNPKGRIIFTLLLFPDENGVKIAVNSDLSDNFYHYVTMRKFRMDLNINKTNDSIQMQHDFTENTTLSSLSLVVADTAFITNNTDLFWRFIFASGLPWITDKTTELFIPQHMNLDKSKIIDFEKGCYPGQEIIARLHYIGKVKKRMTLIQTNNELTYQAGDKAFIEELDQEVEFCSPIFHWDAKWHAQAIIKSS